MCCVRLLKQHPIQALVILSGVGLYGLKEMGGGPNMHRKATQRARGHAMRDQECAFQTGASALVAAQSMRDANSSFSCTFLIR